MGYRFRSKQFPATQVSAWFPNATRTRLPKFAFVPSAIAGLTVWFDATDFSTITESSGAVSQWNDKSGNGFNVTQATGANQPATGNRTINGLNVIDFDGGDRLESGFNITQFTTSKAFTAFVLVQSDRTNDLSEGFVSFGRSGTFDFSSGFLLERRTTFLGLTIGSGAGGFNSVSYNAARFSNSSTSAMIFAATTSAAANTKSASVDNASQTLTTFDGTMATSNFLSVGSANHGLIIGGRVGFAAQFLDGAVGEVVVYDRVLDAGESLKVHQYLSGKWGVAI